MEARYVPFMDPGFNLVLLRLSASFPMHNVEPTKIS